LINRYVIRNLIILIIYATGIPYLRYLYYRARGIPLLRIICWHDIDNKNNFEKKIIYLKKKYNIISLNDFMQNRMNRHKINIAITFDDAQKSWISNAIPILEKYNIPSTFFITSGYVDKNEIEGKEMLKHMDIYWGPGLSSSDIKKISKNSNFTIGSHGLTHRDISTLSDDELKNEILKDKFFLENLANKKIEYYAFPLGHKKNFNKKIFKYYKQAFSIIPGFNFKALPCELIHRDSINPNESNIIYKAWLSGAYDWYPKIKRFIPY